MNLPKELGEAFSAGVFGGLAAAVALWLAGRLGLLSALGVKLGAGLSLSGLYPRIVWGGLWAFLFLLGRPQGGGLETGPDHQPGPGRVPAALCIPGHNGPGYTGPGAGAPDPGGDCGRQHGLGPGRGGLVQALRPAGLSGFSGPG